MFFAKGGGQIRAGKYGRDGHFVRAVFNGGHVAARTQHKPKRFNDDGLPGARFSGEYV